MYQILSGNMYSNVIMNEFQGQMTPELLIDIENAASEDASGRTQMWWDDVKKSAEYDRYMTKYSEFLSRSSVSNSLLAEENIKNSNNVFDVEFVLVPFGTDTTVTVSDKEIEEDYNAHKNLFPVQESRNIEYIVVEFNEENEETVLAQVDSVFNNVKIDDFRQVAVDNGFFYDTIENMQATAELLQGAKGLQRVELLRYHKTAGAKYPMVGIDYAPGFDEDKVPEIHDTFTERNIKLLIL